MFHLSHTHIRALCDRAEALELAIEYILITTNSVLLAAAYYLELEKINELLATCSVATN